MFLIVTMLTWNCEKLCFNKNILQFLLIERVSHIIHATLYPKHWGLGEEELCESHDVLNQKIVSSQSLLSPLLFIFLFINF